MLRRRRRCAFPGSGSCGRSRIRCTSAIFDELAVLVGLACLGAPAVEILVEPDAHHLVGREKAVGDALPQGIGVERVAEVMDVGNVAGFLGRGGEADLGGR
jgi:hypothetical protein